MREGGLLLPVPSNNAQLPNDNSGLPLHPLEHPVPAFGLRCGTQVHAQEPKQERGLAWLAVRLALEQQIAHVLRGDGGLQHRDAKLPQVLRLAGVRDCTKRQVLLRSELAMPRQLARVAVVKVPCKRGGSCSLQPELNLLAVGLKQRFERLRFGSQDRLVALERHLRRAVDNNGNVRVRPSLQQPNQIDCLSFVRPPSQVDRSYRFGASRVEPEDTRM